VFDLSLSSSSCARDDQISSRELSPAKNLEVVHTSQTVVMVFCGFRPRMLKSPGQRCLRTRRHRPSLQPSTKLCKSCKLLTGLCPPVLPRERKVASVRMEYAEQWRLRVRLVHNTCTPSPSLSAIDMACEAFVDRERVRQEAECVMYPQLDSYPGLGLSVIAALSGEQASVATTTQTRRQLHLRWRDRIAPKECHVDPSLPSQYASEVALR
jgi:hypothetical protein